MILNIILIVVIVLSLIVVLFILGTKLPRLKTLKLETLAEAKSAEVKNKILIDRMKRRSQRGKTVAKKYTAPFWQAIKNIYQKISNKFSELEKKYQKEAVKGQVDNSAPGQHQIKILLDEAFKFFKEENFVEAEKKFIEIISLDPKNLKAYKGLGQVYLEIKEYKQAEQTFLFVLQLEKKNTKLLKVEKGVEKYSNAHQLADAYINLGEVYSFDNQSEKALTNYEKALGYEPHNPRNIDQILNLAIEMKNKNLAFDMVQKLESVNPENQKLKEYKEIIANL